MTKRFYIADSTARRAFFFNAKDAVTDKNAIVRGNNDHILIDFMKLTPHEARVIARIVIHHDAEEMPQDVAIALK
jgi:hypothetical protein